MIALQLYIACTGLLAAWLNHAPEASTRRWACLIGLAGQPAWLYTAWVSGQWGVLIVTIGYTVAFIRGVRTYWVVSPNLLRLRLAIWLLNFMPPNTCLAKVQRSSGAIEWDAGHIHDGGRLVATGLPSLLENEPEQA